MDKTSTLTFYRPLPSFLHLIAVFKDEDHESINNDREKLKLHKREVDERENGFFFIENVKEIWLI